MEKKKIISVIWSSKVSADIYELSLKIGKSLIDNGYIIQCGGLGGVMKGVCEGARLSSSYTYGCTIAIIPSFDNTQVNEYADIVIPTGLEIMRNCIVVNADAVVVLGGNAGTLSEIALAWSMFKLLISFKDVDGWGKKLANCRVDGRDRYPSIPEDCVYGVSSVKDMILCLEKYLIRYNRKYKGIYWND